MVLCKALVVEPDEKTRETIDEIFATLDCTYEIADSLAQARKMLARSDHDLVLPAFDMPSRTGSKRRPQNAEHFMVALRKARPSNMPKVIMLLSERPGVSHVNVTRWAFDMRDLGVSDVVDKPLADEGRTLDRVIKKVMGISDSAVREGSDNDGGLGSEAGGESDDGVNNWLTVTSAAELLMRDLPSLDLARARSRISMAANRAEFRSNGSRRDRRIERVSFDAWRLKQRDRDLDHEDEDSEP